VHVTNNSKIKDVNCFILTTKSLFKSVNISEINTASLFMKGKRKSRFIKFMYLDIQESKSLFKIVIYSVSPHS